VNQNGRFISKLRRIVKALAKTLSKSRSKHLFKTRRFVVQIQLGFTLGADNDGIQIVSSPEKGAFVKIKTGDERLNILTRKFLRSTNRCLQSF
jgi:hypothetical protein